MTGGAPAPGPLVVGYARRHPGHFALAVARGDADAAETLLEELPDDVLPTVVVHLPPNLADRFVDRIPDETLCRWLSEPDLEVAVRLARGVAARRYAGLAEGLPQLRRRQLDRHRSFPDGVAGTYVDVDALRIEATATVADAVREMGARKARSRAPLLVVDSSDRLLGFLDAGLALQHDREVQVGDCVAPSPPLPATADVRMARDEFTLRGQSWLPVADAEGRLLGVLYRDRLPQVERRRSAESAPAVVLLSATLLELLAELPALITPEKRAS